MANTSKGLLRKINQVYGVTLKGSKVIPQSDPPILQEIRLYQGTGIQMSPWDIDHLDVIDRAALVTAWIEKGGLVADDGWIYQPVDFDAAFQDYLDDPAHLGGYEDWGYPDSYH